MSLTCALTKLSARADIVVAAGKPSQSPPPSAAASKAKEPAVPASKIAGDNPGAKSTKPTIPSQATKNAKRKLVGEAADAQAAKESTAGGKAAPGSGAKKAKKAKPAKGMLSFDEGEGEE